MMQELIQDRRGGILTLTLNRPDRGNATTHPMIRQLRLWLEEAAVDPSVRVVVLQGAGASFSVGGDVAALSQADVDDPVVARNQDHPAWHDTELRSDRIRLNSRAAELLYTMPKPTIAVLRGHAIGAPLGMALACDFRLASDTLKLRTGFAGIGLSGDYGVSYQLLKLAGPTRAREILMLNEVLDAEATRRDGLVGRVLPDAELDDAASALAQRLAEGPGLAYRHIKANLVDAETASFGTALDLESLRQARAVYSGDAQEAIAAFQDKRPPRFRGY